MPLYYHNCTCHAQLQAGIVNIGGSATAFVHRQSTSLRKNSYGSYSYASVNKKVANLTQCLYVLMKCLTTSNKVNVYENFNRILI